MFYEEVCKFLACSPSTLCVCCQCHPNINGVSYDWFMDAQLTHAVSPPQFVWETTRETKGQCKLWSSFWFQGIKVAGSAFFTSGAGRKLKLTLHGGKGNFFGKRFSEESTEMNLRKRTRGRMERMRLPDKHVNNLIDVHTCWCSHVLEAPAHDVPFIPPRDRQQNFITKQHTVSFLNWFTLIEDWIDLKYRELTYERSSNTTVDWRPLNLLSWRGAQK